MVDYRVEWFRDRVLTLIGEQDEDLFSELLFRNEGVVKDKLISFISNHIVHDGNAENRVVFFYTTFHEKIIEHEIVVAKKASATRFTLPHDVATSDTIEKHEPVEDYLEHSKSPPIPPAPPPSAVKSKKGVGGKKGKSQRGSITSDTNKNSKRTSISGGKIGKRGRRSPSTVVETVTDAEDLSVKDDTGEEVPKQKEEQPSEITYVTRVDQEVVLLPVLHCTFGYLSRENRNLYDTPVLMFLRQYNVGVPCLDTEEKSYSAMAQAFIVGSFVGPALPALCLMLEKVFAPLLAGEVEASPTRFSSLATATGSSRSSSLAPAKPRSFREEQLTIPELLYEIKPLTLGLLQYEKSQTSFNMSKKTKVLVEKIERGESDVASCMKDLEAACSVWITQIQTKLDNLAKMTRSSESPIAEIAYWEDQETALSGISWKLKCTDVERLRAVLAGMESSAVLELSSLIRQIDAMLADARAITRSLAPSAGHFKELSENTSLVGMRHVLARLVDGLRLVWILCTPFAKDDRMEPLLERVAWLICHKVALRLHMDTLFKQGAEKALTKAKQGSKLLRAWKDLYFQARESIEISEHTPRWEFDCKKLFGHSEYIREVCVDLTEVCKALIHFRAVLTPELKAAISTPSSVDTLLKQVSALIAPIQQDADFEVFLACNADSWRSFINHFRRNVLILEQEVCDFFQETFTLGNISSSLAILNLLTTYSATETRENIRTLLMSKYELVISQFIEEIEQTRCKFVSNKMAPPLLRNQPLAAGAIFWCRLLFNRLKTSVLLFQNVKELQHCPLTKDAFSAYVQLTRQMKCYQDDHFEEWIRKTEDIVTATMNMNVVKIIKKPSRRSVSAAERRLGSLYAPPESRADRSSSESSHITLRPVLASLRWVARAIAAKKRASMGSDSSFVLPHIELEPTSASVASLGLQYQVDFNDQMLHALIEAEQMEQLGLEITPLIKRHAVRRYDLDHTVRHLRRAIENLNSLVSPLNEAQIALLQLALKESEREIEPGVSRLKWVSKSLDEYCQACDKAAQTLSIYIKKEQDCSQKATGNINILKNYNLFYVEPQKLLQVLSWQDFFKEVEQNRIESMALMLQSYEELSKILINLEKQIDNTSTGRRPCMLKYYFHWEQQMYEALLSMAIKNFQYLANLLTGDTVCLQIDAMLVDTTLCLNPSATEAYDILISNVTNLMLGLKQFPRWMAGTCLPCPDPEATKTTSIRATKLFTFLDELAKVQYIRDNVQLIKDAAQNVLLNVKTALLRWKKYSLLWQHNKSSTCTLFAEKKPSIVAYDEKLFYFTNIIQKLDDSPRHVDIGCVRLNLQPLLLQIRNHALSWKQHLAQDVLAASKLKRRKFLSMAFRFTYEMERGVDSEDVSSLKRVLDAIVRIRQTSAEAEVQAQHIEESYRTLTLYDIEVDEGDLKLSRELLPYWDYIRLRSLIRLDELAPLKERYAHETELTVQAFAARCDEFVRRFFSDGPGSDLTDLAQGLTLMRSFADELSTLVDERQRLLQDELLFDVPLTDFSALQEVQEQMLHLDRVFHIYEAQKNARDVWASTLWIDLDPNSLIDGMRHFINMFDDLPLEAQEMPVAIYLRQNMKDFQNTVPMFEALKNDALRERHWQQLMEKTGKPFDVAPENFTLQSLFAMELHQHKEASAAIVLCATREVVIEQLLADVRRAWGSTEFTLLPHIRRGVNVGFLLGSVSEICQLQSDHSNSLEQIFSSPYIGPFLDSVKEWEKTLSHVEETVKLWFQVQSDWLNLEDVYMNEEVNSQLNRTALSKFETCDKNFRLLMTETSKNCSVVAACCRTGCLEELQTLSTTLDESQHHLAAFLASKRHVFPRLNFITDQEVLALIGGEMPQCIQKQVAKLKLFPNICQLEFEPRDDDQVCITGMVSQEGERIQLRQPVDTAHCEVETWLSLLVPRLHGALKYAIKFAIHDFGHTRLSLEQWSIQFIGMVSLAALHVWWTVKVEDVFDKLKKGEIRAMKTYLDELNHQIKYLAKFLVPIKDNLERIKLTSILILYFHFRDIVANLVYNAVTVKTDFLWESQLRFYWEKREDSLIIHQCCYRREFGYEYTGLSNSPLVATPQTERTLLIITQALSMHLGVLLLGEAGVGKTETVREMARLLGHISLVTDCNVAMSWKSVGQILAGLAQSGLWGCLEQMDRLSLSTLSVLSSQIQTIKDAVIMKLSSFNFNNQEIGLNSKMAIFATSSPGYQGRQPIPQTLRALFRPAFCSLPDLQQICNVGLLATGFDNAQVLSKKITELCKYCHEQLSKQPHYNFTMGLIQSVLKFAKKARATYPESSENSVILRTLRDCILPSLVPEDIELFLALLKDMFPRVELPETPRTMLRKAVEKCMHTEGYSLIQSQVDTVMQLNVLLSINLTAILIGSSGSGKSMIIQILKKANTHIGLLTDILVLSPKSCSPIEFFGTVDSETETWKDGLFTYIFRNINNMDTNKVKKKFIIFDGPVDPIWIENINSVLDENKLFTLINGDRIPFKNHCNILFEVGNLDFFSPALLSRVRTLYVEYNTNMHEYAWKKWLKTHSNISVELDKLYQTFVPVTIKNIESHNMKTILHFSTLNMVTQLCYLLDIFLTSCPDAEEHLTCYFIQALYLSLGAMILVQFRDSFDMHVKEASQWTIIQNDSPENPAQFQQLPSTSMFEYFWDPKHKCWSNWSWNVEEYIYDPEKPLSEILVPTSYTTQTIWLLNKLCHHYFHELLFQKIFRPLVLVGTTGSSKTITIQSFLRNLDLTKYLPQSLTLSSSTGAIQVQTVIDSVLQFRTKNVMEPIGGKKVLIFLDDLNMPMVDEYGSRESIEFLRLLFEQGGMYGRNKEMYWKQLKDIGFVGAISVLSGPTTSLDHRFLAQLCMVHLPPPSEYLLHRIFSQILRGHLKDFPSAVLELSDSIVSASLHFFTLLCQALPPTPERWTCHLSTRDLTRLFGGICLSNPSHFCTPESLVRLWRHEVCRVFTDRFESQEDQDVVNNLLRSTIQQFYESYAEHVLRNPILFGDFRNALANKERSYEDLLDFEAVYFLFQEVLEELNRRKKGPRLDLVLFDTALEHLVRLHRVLRVFRGHAVLIGGPGTGRKSLIRLTMLAAHCSPMYLPRSSATPHVLRKALQFIFVQMGVHKKTVALLLSDADLAREGLPEMLHHMILNGWVPDLFSTEEKNTVLDKIKKLGATDYDRETMWLNFQKDCRSRLHVVLSASKEILKKYSETFPCFVSSAALDWYKPWPVDALMKVAKHFISSNELIPQEHRNNIQSHSVWVHFSACAYYKNVSPNTTIPSSPRLYLDYLHCFLQLLEDTTKRNKLELDLLTLGLARIGHARDLLRALNEQLVAREALVSKHETACGQLMQRINQVRGSTEKKKELATEWNRTMERQETMLTSEKFQAKQILETAQPDLDEARNALRNLQKEDYQYIGTLDAPPEAMRLVCGCALLLLRGQRDVTWESTREVLSNPDLIQELSQLCCEDLAYKHIRLIKVQLKKAKDIEDFKNLSNILIGATILQFIEAVMKYCNALREIKPRLEVIIHLESELSQAREAMKALMAEVTLEDQVFQDLQNQHSLITREMQELRDEAATMRVRLLAAEKLFSSLGSEEARWECKLNYVTNALTKLPGDCLIGAAMLNYAGVLRGPHPRQNALEEWCHPLIAQGIPVSQPFQLEVLLGKCQENNSWPSNFAKEDRVTLENYLMTTHGVRFPLCIDPQQQAVQWLKFMDPNIMITSTNDPEMITKLEKAIIGGKSILLQDFGASIDPLLYKLLDKIIILEDNDTYVELGDKQVSYNSAFQLYFNTREGSPQFEANVYTKATVIDCTITAQALESCLLRDVVSVEEPALLRQSEVLVAAKQNAERELYELERTLLHRLAQASQEQLLEDPKLLTFLEETKAHIKQLWHHIEKEATEEAVLVDIFKRYRIIAERASILFSVLVDMAHVAPAYQFSLVMFRKLLRTAVQQTPRNDASDLRLLATADTVTRATYSFACRALFAQHQTCFILTLLLRLQVSQGDVTQTEVGFFTRMSDIEIDPYPDYSHLPQWLSTQMFDNCRKLSKTMPILYGNLTQDILNTDWEEWILSECPENTELPSTYSKLMSPFQKILLLRCLRKDRVIPAVQQYILQCLGEYYITPIIPSMRVLLSESSPQIPVLLLLSQGADPAMELQRLSRQCGRDSGQFVSLALGNGLEQAAIAFLQNAIRRGQWLLLLNCHLSPTVPALAWRVLENTQPHPDFRLWLTSDPKPHLPASLLHSALKVVLEIPKGLKLKLNNTFRKLEVENIHKNLHSNFMATLYVFTHLHATLQERVEYGGSGWNATYNFTKSDFETCVTFLKNYLSKDDNNIPWDVLRSLIGKVVYCGHMNDEYDMRVVNTYLQEFFGDFVFMDQFCFYRDQTISYSLPTVLNSFGILAHIQSLPLGNSCVVLGLHSNAECRHNKEALNMLISQMSQLQTQPAACIQLIAARHVQELNLLESIKTRLPGELDTQELLRRSGSTGPSLSFILRELQAFNNLLVVMKQTLVTLEEALLGKTRMTKEVELILQCLCERRVPSVWTKLCPPTNKSLPVWLEHLKQRHNQYYDWIMKHVPLVVWLPGLHSPRSFLLSVLQSACRKHHWNLEEAGLRLTVTCSQNLPAIQNGTYIRGLHLENAVWDSVNKCLKSAAAGELVANLPVVAVVAVESKPEQLPCSLLTPVYATRRRPGELSIGAPVWELELPCSEHPSNWVLRGVRLLLDPD